MIIETRSSAYPSGMLTRKTVWAMLGEDHFTLRRGGIGMLSIGDEVHARAEAARARGGLRRLEQSRESHLTAHVRPFATRGPSTGINAGVGSPVRESLVHGLTLTPLGHERGWTIERWILSFIGEKGGLREAAVLEPCEPPATHPAAGRDARESRT